MPMKRSSGERTGEGAVLSDKGSPRKEDAIVPIPETSSPGGSRAVEPICPAVPSPLPALGSAPPSTQEGVGEDGRLFEEGNERPHSSLWKEMPSLGKEGQRIQCGGRPSPAPSLPAPGRCQHPCPSPQTPRPPAQGPEVRGRPPLVVCLEGKEERRGEKPKVGLAEGLTGNSTTLA